MSDGVGTERDEDGEVLEKINPKKLTPASRKALRGIRIAAAIFAVSTVLALWAFTREAQQRSDCVSWKRQHMMSFVLTAKLPTTDTNLSADVLAARKQTNVRRAADRKVLFDALGESPC